MLSSIFKKRKERSNGQSVVSKTYAFSSTEGQQEVLHIDRTPFVAVKKDDKWVLAFGRYALLEPMTKEEIQKHLEDGMYNLVMRAVAIIIPTEVAHQIENQYKRWPEEAIKKQEIIE